MGPGCSSWQFGYFLRTARGAHFLGSTQKIWVCGAMVVVLWVSGRHPHSLRLWAYEDVQVLLRCFFYLPSKCDRSYWLYLWHTTSSMKLHFAHFFPMLTFPWRNSRALIVTDANTRSFFHGGSGEHAHRLHVVHKNKSLSTNLNRKLPRLSDLCFTNFITPIQTFYQNELRSRCFIVVIAMPPVLASRVSVATCATRILLLTC